MEEGGSAGACGPSMWELRRGCDCKRAPHLFKRLGCLVAAAAASSMLTPRSVARPAIFSPTPAFPWAPRSAMRPPSTVSSSLPIKLSAWLGVHACMQTGFEVSGSGHEAERLRKRKRKSRSPRCMHLRPLAVHAPAPAGGACTCDCRQAHLMGTPSSSRTLSSSCMRRATAAASSAPLLLLLLPTVCPAFEDMKPCAFLWAAAGKASGLAMEEEEEGERSSSTLMSLPMSRLGNSSCSCWRACHACMRAEGEDTGRVTETPERVCERVRMCLHVSA
jgi:hypothetical protein